MPAIPPTTSPCERHSTVTGTKHTVEYATYHAFLVHTPASDVQVRSRERLTARVAAANDVTIVLRTIRLAIGAVNLAAVEWLLAGAAWLHHGRECGQQHTSRRDVTYAHTTQVACQCCLNSSTPRPGKMPRLHFVHLLPNNSA